MTPETGTTPTAPAVSAGATTAPVAPAHMVNSATLLIGRSGTGKSSLLATYAEYVWETFHKVTRYYLFDGGGFPSQVQALINVGIMQVWRVRTRSAPDLVPETIHRASQGYWPRLINPLTGECAPNETLVAPLTGGFDLKCPNGHVVKSAPHQTLLNDPMVCPVCKVGVSATNRVLAPTFATTKGFEHIGAVCYDGLTSATSWLMEDLSHRQLGGEKGTISDVTSGMMRFGVNNRAQIGFAHARAENWVLNAQSIPGLVVPPVWTALPREASDEGNLTVAGIEIVGQAQAVKAYQWFGNAVEPAEVTIEGVRYRRLYLSSFTDQGVRHPCKTRSMPGMMPAYLEDAVDGATPAVPFTNFNLGTMFRLLDKAVATVESGYRERFKDAPGVGTVAVEVGDALPPPPPVVTPGAQVGQRPGGVPAPAAVPAGAVRPGTRPGTPVVTPPATAVQPSAPVPAQTPPVVSATEVTAAQPPPSAGPAKAPVVAPPPGRPRGPVTK